MYLPNAKDDIKIKELSKVQFERLINKTRKKIYLVSYERDIKIILENEYIYIENYWIQIFRNITGDNYIYPLSPWLLPGIEFDSYCFTKIIHNRKNINMDNYRPLDPPKLAPNNKYYIKYDIRIPFDKQEEQTIIVNNSYKTNYAEFFHTYTFGMYCETFNLRARIIDKRDKKENSYALRWQIFPDADLKRDVSTNMITQEPDYISFSNLKWMSPGTGYIITLNYMENREN